MNIAVAAAVACLGVQIIAAQQTPMPFVTRATETRILRVASVIRWGSDSGVF